MVASREVEIPFYRRVGRQRGQGFGVLAQVIGRTAIPFLRKKIVPGAKRVGYDLLEFRISRQLQGVWQDRLLENSWVLVARRGRKP